ncbi:hypothetical protein FOZ62_008120 [Perkinsus olseni]|uniref:Phosphoglycerate mutase n=1 Tax=Perkinsus olseni TaxID=32597 RepID=A0A7J6U308_PEROL|nr:hypothetical protein FOZ62_008120 [Perkinsus olseni]
MPETTSPTPSIFLIRHGQSEANVANLIVSNPEVGCSSYGLTDVGREQVRASARGFLREYGDAASNMEIVSSDFLRTRQTAELFASEVGFPVDRIQFDARLRERYFGSIDLTSDGSYAKVWQRDAQNESLDDYGAESADSVAARGVAVVKDHVKSSCKVLVLVTHGDVLQILQTALMGLPPNQHRTAVDNINQGVLRPLSRCLPDSHRRRELPNPDYNEDPSLVLGEEGFLPMDTLKEWFKRHGRPSHGHLRFVQRDANKAARERKLHLMFFALSVEFVVPALRPVETVTGINSVSPVLFFSMLSSFVPRRARLSWVLRRPSVSAVMFLATLITADWALFIFTEVLLVFHARARLLAVLSVLCPLISFVGYITPISSVVQAFKARDASNLPMPFLLSQAFLCLISISYGVSVNSPPIWATNLFGLTTQALWMAAARWISGAASSSTAGDAEEAGEKSGRSADRRSSMKSLPDLDGATVSSPVPPPLYSALLATCLACLTLTILSIIPTRVVGFAMCLQGIILSASPLARLGAVLGSRNADSIPLPISLNMVLGNMLWSMFGFYVNDHVIFLPSVVGYTLGVTQIVVIMWCWGYLPYDLSFLKCIFSRGRRNPETTVEMAVREDDPEYADTQRGLQHTDSGEDPETSSVEIKESSSSRVSSKLTDLESGSLTRKDKRAAAAEGLE